MTTGHLLIICLTGLAALRTGLQAVRTIVSGRLAVARVDAAALIRIPDDSDEAPSRVGSRVTVHTKQPDDQTIFGVLAGDYVDRVSLEDAEYVTADGARPLSGRQDIATADIAWIDVHALVTDITPVLE
jgi:hypothetical protein